MAPSSREPYSRSTSQEGEAPKASDRPKKTRSSSTIELDTALIKLIGTAEPSPSAPNPPGSPKSPKLKRQPSSPAVESSPKSGRRFSFSFASPRKGEEGSPLMQSSTETIPSEAPTNPLIGSKPSA